MSLELKNSIWVDLIPHNVADLARTRRAGIVGSPVLVTQVQTGRAANARPPVTAMDQPPGAPVEELARLLNLGARARPWLAWLLGGVATLVLIAWVSLAAIGWWNELQARDEAAEAAAAPTWTVTKGETLYQIAKKQNVTVADLRAWNQITGDRIEIGQVLKVGPPPLSPPVMAAPTVVAPQTYSAERTLSLVIAVLALVGAGAARWQTLARKRVVQLYVVDEPAAAAVAGMMLGLEGLRTAARLWRVFDQTRFGENFKWVGGAGVGVNLSLTGLLRAGPRQVKCNAPIYGLSGMGLNLYFLPDGVLVHYLQQNQFVGQSYAALRAEAGRTRMLVETVVPSDARQVGTSWAKVNKDGSPDLRFKYNRQIPVCEYGVLEISGANSLDETWYTSRSDAPDLLARSWSALAQIEAMPLPRSAASSSRTKPVEADEVISDTPTVP